MKNSFLSVIAIVGSIIGSGFISGKEIVVFFSRFGIFSYPCIVIVFFLLFSLFKVMLNKGEVAISKLKNSKISCYSNLVLCFVFSSAMFAGVGNLLNKFNYFFSILVMCIVLFMCYLVYKNGLGSLQKINVFFIPIMLIIFLANLLSIVSFEEISYENFHDGHISIFYAILYVVLNVSNGSVLICNLGNTLSKKQRTRVAFISALVLSLILLLANIILLQNQSSFAQEMPLLSLFSGWQKVIMIVVVFIGCITTLFSLVYTSSFSMRGLCKNEFLIFLESVFLPLLVSLFGFSFIVLYLYPLIGILGGVLLFDLFFIPFFKRTYKKIHSSSKNTK